MVGRILLVRDALSVVVVPPSFRFLDLPQAPPLPMLRLQSELYFYFHFISLRIFSSYLYPLPPQ